MSKKKIGILFGGKSGEHEVSLISAASVYTHIDTTLFIPVLIGVDYNGQWYLQDPPRMDSGQHSLILQVNEEKRVSACPGGGLSVKEGPLSLDAVFPVLHGTFGEDGTIQGLLEVIDVPYIGAGVLGSSLGMDKVVVKKVWLHDGLATVPFVQADSHTFQADSGPRHIAEEAEALFNYPLFVKPARSGSSVGISRAENREGLIEAMKEAFRFDTKLLIEPEIKGREVECSVMGNEEVKAYGVGEIVPTHGFYDYETKYIDPDAAELRIPAPISRVLTDRVKEIAKAAYRSAGAEGFARVDFFIEPDNTVVLNEINTIPGFTHISMFPKLCEFEGLEYGKLVTDLINLGFDRYAQRASLRYRRI